MMGIARAATKGRKIMADNQGISMAFITVDNMFLVLLLFTLY
jgi:hypothetical protein